ncbi:hypothetical protein WL10_24265 [Burkholderia ubonensis]|uniref:hypothetical protein n=1 Tax=Burkholderia ubonensis TaxID=101571 RepID=UPI00076074DD|nr:hypothetical protein [Burkholderia ubonensis]KVX85400.1 hypothetical protein WL10_24265 [Burkholderia ubonensis]
MQCNLIFVHGRAQEMKDAAALKEEWIAALEEGLAASGLSLPLAVDDIRFPYYGQTLYDLTRDAPDDQVAEVVIKGAGQARKERTFLEQVLEEVAERGGVSSAQIQEEADADVIGRGGPLNDARLQAILKAIDRHIPLASGASIALATRDVYQYLSNPGVRDVIDTGVRNALTADRRSVIVAHSLGTVVAYNLLRRESGAQNWKVPSLITLGSPLGVTAIRKRLAPIAYPTAVGPWFNARDPCDVVALYPLDATSFPLTPSIENKNDVLNETENRHGISGYLSDAEVARRIHDALTQGG